MSLFNAAFSLLLLAFTAAATVQARGAVPRSRPTAATLQGCQNRCGDLNFDYPFGIGRHHCFKDREFRLICNDTAQPARLFLNDGTTEVLENIYADTIGT